MSATATFTECEQALLKRVKEAILRAAPSAEITLFGSRARGDAQEDSDWDLLVLVDDASDEVQRVVRETLLAIELETHDILLAITKSKEYWTRSLTQATPLYREIAKDGIRL